MRRVWVLTVLVAAACGAESDVPTRGPRRSETARTRPNATTGTDGSGRGRARAPSDDSDQPREEPRAITCEAPDPPRQGTARVVGRVVDANGDPIFGAWVKAFLGVTTEGGKSDSDGAFRLSIERPTGVVRCLAWDDGHSVAVGEWVALRADQCVDVGTLRCGVAAPIEGWISGPDGARAIGFVSIEWTDAYDAETWACVQRCAELDSICVPYSRSGADGFAIGILPPGRYRLRVKDDGVPHTLTAPAFDIVLSEPAPEPIEWESDLRVTDFDGSAVTDFRWSLGDVDDARPMWRLNEGSEALTIRFASIRGVGVDVHVVARDGREAEGYSEPEQLEPVEIRLPPPDTAPPRRSLRGVVTYDRRPLTWVESRASMGGFRGVRVELKAFDDTGNRVATSLTSTEGTFVLDDLGDGVHTVWGTVDKSSVGSPPLASACVTIRAGDGDVVIEMPASLSRAIRLVPPDDSTCVDDIDPTVEGTGGGPESTECCSTRDGLVVFGLRADHPYSLSLRVLVGSARSAPMVVQSFTAGGPPIELHLAARAGLSGTLVRADGTPVIGAYVSAESTAGGEADGYSGMDGKFEMTGLEHGAWSVTAWAPGLSSGENVVVTDAGTTGLRIVMQSER